MIPRQRSRAWAFGLACLFALAGAVVPASASVPSLARLETRVRGFDFRDAPRVRAEGGLSRELHQAYELVYGGIASGSLVAPSRGAKPQWLQDVEAGDSLNRARAFDYPHRELYVEKGTGKGYWRLDAYDPGREIVSRKLTQFGQIEEATGIKYVNELRAKYPVNAKIADVPSTPPHLRGQRLQGQLIMEVPVQKGPIPQAVLDAAKQRGVLIRDVFGNVY